MRISWKHDDSFLDATSPIEKRIEVFEAQMLGWQLHIADLIINGGQDHEQQKQIDAIPHGAFAALQVALVYFETIAKYQAGYTGKESRRYFVEGVISVFPEVGTLPYSATKNFLDVLYEGARCGLYHMSMTAPGIVLARTGKAISFTSSPTTITIDPHVLIPELKNHFEAYVALLRKPAEVKLRDNFERCCANVRRAKLLP